MMAWNSRAQKWSMPVIAGDRGLNLAMVVATTPM
jgi:hypothetical protein